MRRRTVLFLILTAATLLASPALPAGAQTGTETVFDRAATRLRVDPVYVDDEAPSERKISPEAAERLRRQIRDAGTPVFAAILPSTGGNVNDVPQQLYDRVGLAGTYAVVVGGSFRAGSTTLPRGQAGALATAAFQANSSQGTEAVLSDFIRRVAGAGRSAPAGGNQTGPSVTFDEGGGSGDGGGGGNVLPLLLLGGAAGGGYYLWRRSKKKAAEAEADEQRDRSMLQAELQVLADDVIRLEPQIALHPAAADDYDAAASRYRVAQAALEAADDPIDLVKVERVIEEGRYAMARAKARIDGRQPPPPPEDLTRPGRRGEPALDLDDEGRPAYRGYDGSFYGGGGWFGGGGGLLTGLFLGQMLGGFGGFGWGGGYHETNVYNDYGDGGDGGDAGADFGGGGGDWGGGDFGGDFGGGDVGGGDWG